MIIGKLAGSHGLTLASLVCLFLAANLQASEYKSLTQKADEAREESKQVEQAQLKKAKEAANETEGREKKIYKKMLDNDWESEQKAKAQQQFNERESREDKYLREAKEAAAKERKIPKP
ncbi:hypothetical protein [Shewanella sp. UCD-KL12]|uniref:hypothetical protein n=1 Tax=Shewanella sp. UCD-KL12 TaxID=1917163 RepID=UPI00117ED615